MTITHYSCGEKLFDVKIMVLLVTLETICRVRGRRNYEVKLELFTHVQAIIFTHNTFISAAGVSLFITSFKYFAVQGSCDGKRKGEFRSC